MTGDSRVVQKLRGVAARLTSDFDLQKDPLQEMFLHLVQVEAKLPGQTISWYIKGCEFHARRYLARGRSVDSLKRQKNLVPFRVGAESDDEDMRFQFCPDPVDPAEPLGELVTRDIVAQIVEQITDRQQQILQLLLHGLGVRAIARELRVSHPAIVQHRRKIAQCAAPLLVEHRNRSGVPCAQPDWSARTVPAPVQQLVG